MHCSSNNIKRKLSESRAENRVCTDCQFGRSRTHTHISNSVIVIVIVTLEGRTIEYRPGGGLDYHNSPLMAEIPTGDYSSHIRSIDQLRSMNDRGVLQLGPLSATDIRASFVHDYKPFNISDLRNNSDRLDYTNKINGHDTIRSSSDVNCSSNNNNNNNNNNQSNDIEINRHGQQQQQQTDQKAYSSPSTPPTPLSNTDGQMNDSKVNAQF